MVRSCQRSVPHPDMISSRTKPARFTTHRRITIGLPVTLALAVAASPPVHGADATTRADLRFTNYAFAHEFGSGVYDFNGRTLQVYGLPFGWTAVEPGEDRAGLRLRLPVTLGFLDFHAADMIETGLPERVDSVSFVPGVEFAFVVAEHWRLLPYVQGGLSTASESNVETDLFGAGIRAERVFAAGDFDGLYAGTAAYSRVSYHGDSLPNDDFLRLRNSLEFKRYAGFSLGDHPIEFGLFATIDVFADPPTGPTTGIDVPRTQLETGIVFGARPEWKIWKIPLPRVGLSYRFAGDVSAVRFVLGAPF
jgi:hypothetical protein